MGARYCRLGNGNATSDANEMDWFLFLRTILFVHGTLRPRRSPLWVGLSLISFQFPITVRIHFKQGNFWPLFAHPRDREWTNSKDPLKYQRSLTRDSLRPIPHATIRTSLCVVFFWLLYNTRCRDSLWLAHKNAQCPGKQRMCWFCLFVVALPTWEHQRFKSPSKYRRIIFQIIEFGNFASNRIQKYIGMSETAKLLKRSLSFVIFWHFCTTKRTCWPLLSCRSPFGEDKPPHETKLDRYVLCLYFFQTELIGA